MQNDSNGYRALFENNREIMLLVEQSSLKIIDINIAASNFYGLSREKMIQKKIFEYIKIPEDKLRASIEKDNFKENEPLVCTYLSPENKLHETEIYALPLNIEGKDLICLTIHDITRIKTAEEELQFRDNRLKTLVEILQTKHESIREALDYALEKAIQFTESKIGYIFYYSEKEKLFTVNSWSKSAMKECNVSEIDTTYKLEDTGIWGEPVRQRKPIIINDFHAPNPLIKGYPHGHVKINKFLSVPIFRNRKIVAVIAVANKESDYTNSDTLQLTLLMDSVWKVIGQIGAEEALKKSEKKYRRLFENNISDVVITEIIRDEKGKPIDFGFLEVNEFFEKNNGLKAEDIIGKRATELYHGIDNKHNAFFNLTLEVALTGKPLSAEIYSENVNKYFSTNIYQIEENIVASVSRDITKRKEMEQELEESKEKYQMLSDLTFEGIAIHDKGVILEVNEALCRLTGYTKEELIGRNILETTAHPDDIDGIMQQMKKDATKPYEVRTIRKDGTVIITEIESHTITYNGKKVRVAAARDITERKKAEESLAESEKKYRTLFENNMNGILVTKTVRDENGYPVDFTFLDVNDAFEVHTGLRADQVIGKHATEVYPGIEKMENSFIDIHRDVILTGNPLNVEMYSEELKKYFSIVAYPVEEDIAAAVFHDVTERKSTEIALKNSENQLRTLINTIPDLVWLKDINGVFLACNHEFEYFYNVSEEKIIGKTDYDFHDKELADHFRQKDLEALEAGRPLINEEIVTRVSDGYQEHLETIKAPMYDSNGNPIGVLGVGRDITARKNAENKLRDSEKSLEEAQRIAHLGNWDWDITNNELYWSDEVYRIFGHIPQDFKCTYETFLSFVHPDDRDLVKDSVNRALYENEPYSIDHRITLSNGSERIVHEMGEVVFDEGGQPTRMIGTVQDITERKQIENALQESESRVRRKLNVIMEPDGDIGELELADIIDSQVLQSLMDDFYQLAHIGSAVIDNKGNILVASGWQDICIDFHRVHPETCKHCIESDSQLSRDVAPGTFKLYKCKNNMWDIATPIMAAESQLGNLFLGQFFFDDEEIPYDTFRLQAKKYGFDEKEYIEALEKVPRWSRETVNTVMSFYTKLTDVLSSQSYTNIKLARTLSERDELLNSLHDSEEKLKLFIEHAPASLAMFDRDMRYIAVSHRWLTDLSLDDKDIIGMSHYEVLPEITDEWKELHQRAMEGEIIINDESIFKRTDGTSYWLHWEARPWKTSDGTIGGIVIFAEDITERKESQDKIRESEALLNDVGRIAKIGGWEYNIESSVIIFTPEVTRIHEIDIDTLEIAMECYEPESRAILENARVEAIEKGKPFDLELKIITQKNKYKWVRTSGRPKVVDGKVVKIIGTLQDITERKEMEQELMESHDKYQMLSDATFEGIIFHDNGIVLDANEAIFRGTGYTREEIIGKNIIEKVIHPDDLDIVLRQVKEKGTKPYEVRCIKKDGSVFPIEIESYSISYKGKQVRVAAIRDITARKEAEQELKESEERFKVLHNASFGGILIHENNIIRDCNLGLSEITGYSYEELIGMDGRSLFAESSRDTVKENVKTGYEGQYEVLGLRKDGTEYPLQVEARNMPYKGKKIRVVEFRDITERKLAEQELKESEERFKALHNSSFGGITIHDKGVILECNQGLSDMTGYSYDELIGMNGLLLIAESHRDLVLSNILAGYEKPYEARGCRKDGTEYPLRLEARNIPYKGKTVRVVEFRDITEQKLAEEKLFENEEKLRLFIEHAPAALTMLDRDLHHIAVSKRWLEDYSLEEDIIGMHHYKAMPFLKEEWKEAELKALKGEVISSEEDSYIKDDGSVSWLRWEVRPWKTADGSIGGIIIFTEDITQRKEYEEKLLEREALLNEVGKIAKIGGWELDLISGEPTWTPEVTKIYELDVDRAVDVETGLRYYSPESREILEKAVNKLIEKGEPYELELELITVKENHKWVRTSGYPKIVNGKVVKVTGTLQDITQRKSIEEKLLEYAEELEDKNIELDKALIKAEDATKAKSDFLANMSHEIRTPMNGVIGMTNLLLTTKLNEEQKHYVDTVKKSGENLLELINDILDISKIEAGKLELDEVDTNLQDILEEVASLLSVKAHEKELEFICIADPDVPLNIRADPARLKQILINLGGNAIKFTKEGEVAIRATLEYESDSETTLRFSVKDTGIGIPEEKKNLLFQKFSQVDASTTRYYGGTGLGLAISRELVELMNGEIGVENGEGNGSEFWFKLKLKKHPGSGMPETYYSEIKGIHALVVDDNKTNREILVKLLASWNMKVEEAKDGPSAIQKLFAAYEEGNPYQVAILDMQMPGMDGSLLGRIIKSDKDLSNISLVMLSSAGNMPESWKQNKNNFEAYLSKPIKASELFAKLSSLYSDVQRAERKEAAEVEIETSGIDNNRARILLVEDNVVNQHVAQGMLQKIGITADVANNGLEAIEALETIPYDLVLMDIQMPEMDGMEASKHIRNKQSSVINHDVPIIAMTAHAMKGDEEKCIAAGMSDYMSKPINLELLAAKIDKWLEHDPEKNYSSEFPDTDNKVPMIFDYELFMENIMDDIVMAREIIEIFKKNAPRQLEGLKEAIDKKEIENIVNSAHSLKGASASVGGMALSDVSARIEVQAGSGQIDEVMEMLPELEKNYELLVQELDKV